MWSIQRKEPRGYEVSKVLWEEILKEKIGKLSGEEKKKKAV
jgi:hypothetical protein